MIQFVVGTNANQHVARTHPDALLANGLRIIQLEVIHRMKIGAPRIG